MQNKIMPYLESNPRKLFLWDGLGALVSAFLLGIVLVKVQDLVGIPSSTLYVLASLPIAFSLFDGYCYWNKKLNVPFCLKVMATVNVLYCILSIGYMLFHIKNMTYLGVMYIVLEVCVVMLLATIEWRISKRYAQ
jgi:hypothetical protein